MNQSYRYFFSCATLVNLGGGSFAVQQQCNNLGLTFTVCVAPPARPAVTSANMLTNGSFTLNDTGAVSQPYILAEATNLISPITWPFVFTNTADMNGVFNFIDPLKTDYAQRFYRAILP